MPKPAIPDTARDEIRDVLRTLRAQARLRRAGPDLLALARRVADHFADTDSPLGAEARAAIAKATGDV